MPPLLAVADTATSRHPGDLTASAGFSQPKASRRGRLLPSTTRSDRYPSPQPEQQPAPSWSAFLSGKTDFAVGARPAFSKPATGSSHATTSQHADYSFSLRDTLVHNFELALRRQGSLSSSGEMSTPGSSHRYAEPIRPGFIAPSDSDAENAQTEQPAQSWVPTTPPFYASSTSSTPSIPPTPLTDYPASPIYYPQLSQYSPIGRSRSGSLASAKTYMSVSPTLHLNPVVLPIGQKVPKWREVPQWEDTDEEQETHDQASLGASGSPSRHTNSTTPTGRPWRRTTRIPSGPRPMRRAGQYPSILAGLGYNLPTWSPARSDGDVFVSVNDSSCPQAPSSTIPTERRLGFISSPPQPTESPAGSPQLDVSEEHYSGNDDLTGPTGRTASSILDEYLEELEDDYTTFNSDSTSSLPQSQSRYSISEDHTSTHDFMNEPATYLTPDHASNRTSSVAISPLRIPSRHPAYSVSPISPIALPALSVTIPNRDGSMSPPSSRPSIHEQQASTEVERSVFDSDSDCDGDDASALQRRTSLNRFGHRIGRLGRAVGSSVSISSSNLKDRLSLVNPNSASTSSLSASAVDSSPERMTSLRARQLSGFSASLPGSFRHIHMPKFGQQPCLSPIPATPLELSPFHCDLRDSAQLDSPCSLPTPVTPNIERTKSFIWHLANPPPVTPPPLPPVPRFPQRPPSLPLPPTPGSIADIMLSNPVPRRHPLSKAAEIDHWRAQVPVDNRLTTVDPNASMVKLEISIAKLEAYAPQSDSSSSQPSRASSAQRQRSVQGQPDIVSAQAEAGPSTTTRMIAKDRSDQEDVKPPVPPKDPSVTHRSAKGKGKVLTREPSIRFLPKFDFEASDHHHLLRLLELPLRSDSLADQITNTASRVPQLPASSDDSDGTYRGHRHDRSRNHNSPDAAEDSQRGRRRRSRSLSRDWPQKPLPPSPEMPSDHPSPDNPGVSSFMDFSPPSEQHKEKEKRQRSRVRKLLARVHARTDFMRGLRESFNVPLPTS